MRGGEDRRSLLVYGVCGGVVAAVLGVVGYAWSAHRARAYDASHPGGLLRYELTTDQTAELAHAVAAAKSQIIQLDAGWRGAIDALDPAAVTGGDPCPALAPARAGDYTLASAPVPTTVVRADAPLPAVSPEARAKIAELEDHAAVETSSFEARMYTLPRDTPTALATTDVLIQIAHADAGAVVARVWAFDHARHALVCAGLVHATSAAPDVGDDLLTNLVRAIPLQLRAL